MPRTKDLTPRVRRKQSEAERQEKEKQRKANDRAEKARRQLAENVAKTSFFGSVRRTPIVDDHPARQSGVAGTSNFHSREDAIGIAEATNGTERPDAEIGDSS